MATKFTRPQSARLLCVGISAWEVHEAQAQTHHQEELKVMLQNTWDSLEQDKIDKAVLAFRKRLRACVQAEGGHFEHALN